MPDRSADQPAPRARQKILAVLVGLLCALAAGEILVRIVGAPEVAVVQRGRFRLSADPRLLFEPVPGLAVAGDTADFYEYRGASNSLGYRDREHPVAKPPGVFRIAVLGDSIAAGYQVARTADAFPALLEAGLRRDGLRVEVLNFGVTGYNTSQEVETLRARALRFAPDLVLVAYCHNDRRPPDVRILQALRESQKGRSVLPAHEVSRVLVWSALYRFVRYGFLDAHRGEDDPGPAAVSPGSRGGEGDTVEPALRELAALSREHGFEVLLAVFPYLPKPYDERHAREHAWLAERARELGFHHLDLRPAFRACREESRERLGFDRYHPTPAGHRCAARALEAAVRGLVAGRSARPR
jgi:lysophospholipase L1-like esterase